MFKNKMVGVVVPAHNEEKFVAGVIDTMPGYVDKIFVVNDASTDKTREIVAQIAINNTRVALINREVNGGVGAAITTGHLQALKDRMDIIAVMAGDGQMDPAILDHFLTPIVEGKADYTKGNRLSSAQDKQEMPAWRLFGNSLLTFLSRVSSGYWHISDPQDGYTAISAGVLRKLDVENIEKGFAFENNMLVRLNIVGARVLDIPHPAIYRGQRSKIHYGRYMLNTSWILLRDFIWRIWRKYFLASKSIGEFEGSK
ncbi:MAG: WcaA [Chloroflexi bacterium]|nr:WcaA [Chloroflexota bacterium]